MYRLCEVLLFAILLGLPCEYFFISPEQSLYSTLKLQLGALAAAWAALKLTSLRRVSGGATATTLGSCPGRVLAALAVFVVIQVTAALFVDQFRENALRAALKSAVGGLILIMTADLARTHAEQARGDLRLRLLAALPMAGSALAIIGLGQLAGIELFERAAALFQDMRYFAGSRQRFTGTMEYPNTAASFLSASLLATLTGIFIVSRREASVARVALLAAAALVQGAALVLTYSRGAVAATLLALAAIAWMARAWAASIRWRVLGMAASGLLAAGLAGILMMPDDQQPPGERVARYSTDSNLGVRYLEPASTHREIVTVRNDSVAIWRKEEFVLAYRWYRVGVEEVSPLAESGQLSADIPPGSEQSIPLTLSTPAQEGEYYLVWFVARRTSSLLALDQSFGIPTAYGIYRSTQGAPPPSPAILKYLRSSRGERLDSARTLVPGRVELWRAAVKMFRAHPLLGVGPDNFRLLKWSFMDLPKGDDTILANSLYLEFLSGSGVLGLASLLYLLYELGRALVRKTRGANTPVAYAAALFAIGYFVAFLSHGLVDYFLKFTPTFLLFWIVAGVFSAHVYGDDRAKTVSKPGTVAGKSLEEATVK